MGLGMDGCILLLPMQPSLEQKMKFGAELVPGIVLGVDGSASMPLAEAQG